MLEKEILKELRRLKQAIFVAIALYGFMIVLLFSDFYFK